MMDGVRTLNHDGLVTFLRNHLNVQNVGLEVPPSGRGQETYFADCDGNRYFVKLGAHVERYQVMAAAGLTPPVIASGQLESGLSVMVQPLIDGRMPSWSDFHAFLPQVTDVVEHTHHNSELKQVLLNVDSDRYCDVGLATLDQLRSQWQTYRPQLPSVANSVDAALDALEVDIMKFEGGGLVASHNDICNANWMIRPDGGVYLIDLDSMSLDDPARDLGALLWWYYPPELRPKFLSRITDPPTAERMRVRMAMHSLDILLPRPNSFDTFQADGFLRWLPDFWAVYNGLENPRGYDD